MDVVYSVSPVLPKHEQITENTSWYEQMVINIGGYASVLLPGYLIMQYLLRSGYFEQPKRGALSRLLHLCVMGDEVDVLAATSQDKVFCRPFNLCLANKFFSIVFCTVGLLSSYLVWGVLQERIMALTYTAADGTYHRFTNSLFLEFMNRILAFFIACFLLLTTRQPAHTAPLYKYSYNALSNVMSSWCQYEALKYVTFPVQVLAKAGKVIPVMLMGRIVSRKTYSLMEYSTSAVISIGIFMFLVSTDRYNRANDEFSSSIAGLILLALYLAFDAFTANWQSHLYEVYRMSPIQMMAGSNLFSVLYSGVSLLEQGGFIEALTFMVQHPVFIFHIAILSVTSTVGQLFIYFTIDEFGAVTFAIIMTVRQAFAILLSCMIYHHSVSFYGILGLVFCFSALFIKTAGSHSNLFRNRCLQCCALCQKLLAKFRR